ncbi:MAG: PIN domain-containing protein [Propionibacteriaceae bacterium]|nr:PIN domain-containing protein [Propionibacteriaceae bacterium]
MTSNPVAFLDADVLAAPMTRTLIIVSRVHRDALFLPRWSLTVEAEADRHIRGEQRPLSRVRAELDWDSMIVPDAAENDCAEMTGTSPKDRHVLASATSAQARLIVSRNVSDFGLTDLAKVGLDVVHPDLFLAMTMSDAMYLDALDAMSTARSRQPNTPTALHSAFGVGHPRLFNRMSHLFPDVDAPTPYEKPPTHVFRGNTCFLCGQHLDDELTDGLCGGCPSHP